MTEQSKGHLTTANGFEYFRTMYGIYRAPLANPIGVDGFRMGGRFECYPAQWGLLCRILDKQAASA
jgi:hypothetical protein